MEHFRRKINNIEMDILIDCNSPHIEQLIIGVLYSMCGAIASGNYDVFCQKQNKLNDELLENLKSTIK